ncbi:MAG: hypothetical protein Ct9H300mP12_02820 [Acidimicrobiales bacterium]|nr:MAG: hypothetical protein Ct9H300mP12_02820 [Acidimicrobiales bacterium]
MLECAPGMIVDTESERTRKAQDGVLEFLLVNHPLDCPVCDKGGECPLPDQPWPLAPGGSRFVEEKRHFEKPIFPSTTTCNWTVSGASSGPVHPVRRRGGGRPTHSLHGPGRSDSSQYLPRTAIFFVLQWNTVQICPVGALTATPYRFKARPWDLDEVESTSTLDSVGSRIAVQSSHDRVLRFQGVDADAPQLGMVVGQGTVRLRGLRPPRPPYLTDVAWRRVGQPDPDGDLLVAAPWNEALDVAAAAPISCACRSDRRVGWRAYDQESQYAWAKLAKGVLGTDHVEPSWAMVCPPRWCSACPVHH